LRPGAATGKGAEDVMKYRVLIREGKPVVPPTPSRSATAAFVLYYHITFRTKWNKKVFERDGDAASMLDTLLGVCREKGYGLMGLAVMPDHVHAVVSLKPDVAPAEAVRYLKGVSAREFNRVRGASGSIWSDGYSVEAVGRKNIWQIMSYVARQDTHHGVVPG
jgi:putative transposase